MIGLISRLLAVLLGIALAILAGTVFAVLIEWIGMAFGFWSHTHAQEILTQELRWAGAFTTWVDFNAWLSQSAATLENQSWIIQYGGHYGLAALFTGQLSVLRALLVVSVLPAVLIFWVVAVLDGLLTRDLRKFGVAHESGYIYHYAKSLVGSLIAGPPLLFLSAPVSVHPSLLCVLFGCPSSIGLWLTVSRFKKYL